MIRTGSIVIENDTLSGAARFTIDAPDDKGMVCIHGDCDNVAIADIPFDDLLEVLKIFAKQQKD